MIALRPSSDRGETIWVLLAPAEGAWRRGNSASGSVSAPHVFACAGGPCGDEECSLTRVRSRPVRRGRSGAMRVCGQRWASAQSCSERAARRRLVCPWPREQTGRSSAVAVMGPCTCGVALPTSVGQGVKTEASERLKRASQPPIGKKRNQVAVRRDQGAGWPDRRQLVSGPK